MIVRLNFVKDKSLDESLSGKCFSAVPWCGLGVT